MPSLAESDCAGELELIRYTICTSAMAFEDSAAAAISWERSLSLGSRLDRAHSAFQLALVKDYWENRQGYLRRRHAPRAPLAKFSTKRGRRQHQQELRRARAHRKSHRNTMPRPAHWQPAVQFRSPFPFAPPTAPSIPLTASKGVFTFGAAVRSNISAHRPANLNTAPRPPGRDTGTRSAFTTQSDRPKVHRGPGGPVQAKRCHPHLRRITARQLVQSGGRHFGARLRPRINRFNGSTSCHPPFSYPWPKARFTTP